MLRLSMLRGALSPAEFAQLKDLLSDPPEGYRAVLGQALETQAEALQVSKDAIFGGPQAPRSREGIFGELLAIADGFIAMEVSRAGETAESHFPIDVYGVGGRTIVEAMDSFGALIADRIGVRLQPWHYESPRMKEMLADGMQPISEPLEEELAGARILADRDARTIAIAVASSGGLLVGDIPKQLPTENRDQAEGIVNRLQEGDLVASELLVICRQSSRQIARVPDEVALRSMSEQGLKCACGRLATDERVESALAITPYGASLLEGSRWLSVLVATELLELGVSPERIFLEQTDGGEEMDCFADVSGELVFFELKDKEFSLGNAYSFGAKIGIHRPDHSAIITSAYVGNDAKDHFKKAERSAVGDTHLYFPSRAQTKAQRGVRYIEGIENLREGLEQLVGEIYALDAQRALSEIVRFGAINAEGLVQIFADMSGLEAKDPTQSVGI